MPMRKEQVKRETILPKFIGSADRCLKGAKPTAYIVEGIKAWTKGGGVWDKSFFSLEVGKQWFYRELSKLEELILKQGWQTKELRGSLGLKKTRNKQVETFYTYCFDSWVPPNSITGGHAKPDNTSLMLITPFRFHRRQLHGVKPEKGGTCRPYGSTLSLGLKRGSLVKHVKLGLVYVGSYLKNRLSLHSLTYGERLGQKARKEKCKFITFNVWRRKYA